MARATCHCPGSSSVSASFICRASWSSEAWPACTGARQSLITCSCSGSGIVEAASTATERGSASAGGS